MAKKRSKSKSKRTDNEKQRYASDIPKSRDLLFEKNRYHKRDTYYGEDFRYFRPENYWTLLTLDGRSANLVKNLNKTRQKRLRSNYLQRFANPKRTVVCRKRYIRRAVLFALNKTTKGAGAKVRRFTWRSKISCKR